MGGAMEEWVTANSPAVQTPWQFFCMYVVWFAKHTVSQETI